jgi:hypothetical protein
MDPNILRQLGLNSDLSGNDTALLQKVFSGMNNGKKVKITPQERNQLMAQLTNQNSTQYVPTKEFKDMTPDEKKVHREILKKRLREKQKNMAQMRMGGNKQVQKNTTTSLQEMLSKIDLNQLNNHAEAVAQSAVNNSSITNTTTNVNTEISNYNEQLKEESLDDFVEKE